MRKNIFELGLDQLPLDERITLAQEQRASAIAEAPPGLLTPKQLAELERRAVEDDANPDDVIPREVVTARILNRLGQCIYPSFTGTSP